MREIKFRAWEKNLKQIISVDDINFETGTINTRSAWRQFFEIELMQFTGLKDNLDVDIYERDIVELYGDFDEDGVCSYTKSEVIFYEGCFCITDSFEYGKDPMPISQWLEDGGEFLVVIGNVFEHKHLLDADMKVEG